MTKAVWNHAPKRLWRRVSVYIRPDIHAAADDNEENFTLFLNNALARKYDLDPCQDGGVRRVNRLRRLEQTNEVLEQEIASLSVELQEDGLNPDLRSELERQRAEIVAQRDTQSLAETEATSRAVRIRASLDAIIGEGSVARHRRALPENDPSGNRIDDLDDLVARVSRSTGIAVEPAEVIGEIRRRAAAADALEGP